MAMFYVEKQPWQRWPKVLTVCRNGKDGIVRRRYTPEKGTCELISFADVPFNVDYAIEGYDSSSGKDYATLAECSECGALVIVPPEYHRALTCDDDTVYLPYEYCPVCGNKVEEVQ